MGESRVAQLIASALMSEGRGSLRPLFDAVHTQIEKGGPEVVSVDFEMT